MDFIIEMSDLDTDKRESSVYKLVNTIEENITEIAERPISPVHLTKSTESNDLVSNKETDALLIELRQIINDKANIRFYLPLEKRERANSLLDTLEIRLQDTIVRDRRITVSHREVQTSPKQTSPKEEVVCLASKQKTYASAASTKATILLYPNDSCDKSDPNQILNLIKKEVRQDKFRVKRVQKIRNNGVAIDFEDESNIDKIIQEINCKPILKDNLKPITIRKKLPKVIIYGISMDTKKEEMAEFLRSALGDDQFEVLFPIKGRTDCNHWVIRVQPPTFRRVMREKKILIEWEFHRIQEFISVRRCTKCQALDHSKSHCPFENFYCGYCGNAHRTESCTENYTRCINCCLSNQHFYKGYPTHHTAMDPNCPSYIAKLNSIKRNVIH